MSTHSTPPALLWGVRRYLAAPRAEIAAIRRQPFPGGLSGSRLEYWHLRVRKGGVASNLTLVYKQGRVVGGAFLQGAPQREALAYTHLPGRVPLALPRVVALSVPSGEIWMLPFSRTKPTNHWHAAWNESDIHGAIADLARLHAAFWNQAETPEAWPWLLQPTQADAARQIGDGRAGLERIQSEKWFDASLTPDRVARLLALARDPSPMLTILNAGPMTLLHGDAGFQNVAITQDGFTRIWFDWQLVGWGPPALDWVTFLHPWAYPEAQPPLTFPAMSELYLAELARRGCEIAQDAFQHQLDAALIWRWIIQWGPLLGLYRERLRPQVKARLDQAFAQLHWPALERFTG